MNTSEEIKPVHVNSSQARILKEKGFDETCTWAYLTAEKYGVIGPHNVKTGDTVLVDLSKESLCNTLKNSMFNKHVSLGVSNYIASAPEQWMVVEWLRTKHNIWLVVNLGLVHNEGIMYYANVIKFGTHHKSKHKTVFYNTPQEAYSAAIDHVLINLI